MTELITGAKGTAHVTSSQQGAINAYTIGTGAYILNGCAATMPAANTLHIAAGHLMVQGRAVEVTATDLTISNGSQGMKRHDLVCMSYAFASNVESATLAVVQGTPSASPSDPSVAGSILNGDATAQIPLWRVTLDGITPTVEQIASTYGPVTLWSGSTKTGATLSEPVEHFGHIDITATIDGRAWPLFTIKPGQPYYQIGSTTEARDNPALVRPWNLIFTASGKSVSIVRGSCWDSENGNLSAVIPTITEIVGRR